MNDQLTSSAEPKPSALVKRYLDQDPRARTPIKKAPPRPWIKLLDRIDDEATTLLRHRQTWQTFRDIFTRSSVAQGQPYFPLWVGELYGPTQALGIRKMADDDNRTGSFVRLLTKLAAEPGRLTREWFIGGTEAMMAVRLDQTFTRLADPQYTGAMDPSVPQHDLELLLSLSHKVRTYVNQHVAHAQLNLSAPIPTYGEIDDALDFLYKLLHKYTLLLKQSDRIEGPPIVQAPWDRIFYEAWLPSGRNHGY